MTRSHATRKREWAYPDHGNFRPDGPPHSTNSPAVRRAWSEPGGTRTKHAVKVYIETGCAAAEQSRVKNDEKSCAHVLHSNSFKQSCKAEVGIVCASVGVEFVERNKAFSMECAAGAGWISSEVSGWAVWRLPNLDWEEWTWVSLLRQITPGFKQRAKLTSGSNCEPNTSYKHSSTCFCNMFITLCKLQLSNIVIMIYKSSCVCVTCHWFQQGTLFIGKGVPYKQSFLSTISSWNLWTERTMLVLVLMMWKCWTLATECLEKWKLDLTVSVLRHSAVAKMYQVY